MADLVFNISKGAVAEKIRNAPNAIGVLLLKVTEADTPLIAHADLAVLLAAAGNTEADFTNYVRKTGITGVPTVDNTFNRTEVDIPDQVWALAGGATNNTLVKVVIFLEVTASDSGRIPLCMHDFPVTTDGTNMTVNVDPNGFFRAA